MPLKGSATHTTRITPNDRDISMVEDDKVDSQLITMKELRAIVEQMNNNTKAVDNKVQSIGVGKVKLLSIKRFNGTRSKLKGFLSQIRFKVTQEGLKIGTIVDQVTYVGLFLTGRVLRTLLTD